MEKYCLLFLLYCVYLSQAHVSGNGEHPFPLKVVDNNHWTIRGAVASNSQHPSSRIAVKRTAVPVNFHSNHSCYIITLQKGPQQHQHQDPPSQQHKQQNQTLLCYPLVTVGGVSKCGTSALYNILAGHKKIFAATKEKCNAYLLVRIAINCHLHVMSCGCVWVCVCW